MTSPGFAVSLADLRGFANQIRALGSFYEFELAPALEPIHKDALFPVGQVGEPGGPLPTTLTEFNDDHYNLMSAEHMAFEGLGEELQNTGDDLYAVYQSYKDQDEQSADDIGAAGGGAGGSGPDDAAGGGAGSGESEGEAHSDWRRKLELSDYLTKTVKDYDPLDYPTVISHHNGLKSLEDVLSSTLEIGFTGTIDWIIQEVTGHSLTKEIVRPLILGDWGCLWFAQDLYVDAAEAVTAVKAAMGSGANVLLHGGSGGAEGGAHGPRPDWTGPAAVEFEKHSTSFTDVLTKHADNLSSAAALLGGMADLIDTFATDIALLIQKVIDGVLGVGAALRTGGWPAAFVEAGKVLPGLIEPALTALWAFVEAEAVANTSTQDLVDEALGLRDEI